MKVRDIMTETLDTIAPGASLHDALRRMNLDGCRHLPVVDDGDLVGVITDRDIRLAINSPVLEEGVDVLRREALDALTVRECMTPDPEVVGPDTAAAEVADLLSLSKFGAMPVVDGDELIGIISYVDFLRYFAAGNGG